MRNAVILFMAAFCMISCAGKNQEYEMVWIQDKKADQPVSLFPDADSLFLDSLGIEGAVPSSINVFLAEKDGKVMLFDAGLGLPGSGLMMALDSLGISPSEVDYVFLTHFHGDHIGGMTSGDSAVFSNAEVYASRAEYEAWMAMPDAVNLQAVKTMAAYGNRVRLFGFGDTLPCGVVAIDASGHTPGHSAFRLGDVIVAGDIMHGVAIQLINPEICATYDMDKALSAEARKRIMEYAVKNRLLVAGMHFPEGFVDYR